MAAPVTARWCRWSGDGLEHLHLAVPSVGPRVGAVADGMVIGTGDAGEAFAVRYRIECDAGWRVRALHVERLGGDRRLDATADGTGGWADRDGQPLAAIDGAVDVDLSESPFTNTLPIRRLGLRTRESAEIAVAYVSLPTLDLRLSRQRYTCLKRDARYRFESLDNGFTADLDVDEHGLVVCYPGLFQRVL